MTGRDEEVPHRAGALQRPWEDSEGRRGMNESYCCLCCPPASFSDCTVLVLRVCCCAHDDDLPVGAGVSGTFPVAVRPCSPHWGQCARAARGLPFIRGRRDAVFTYAASCASADCARCRMSQTTCCTTSHTRTPPTRGCSAMRTLAPTASLRCVVCSRHSLGADTTRGVRQRDAVRR